MHRLCPARAWPCVLSSGCAHQLQEDLRVTKGSRCIGFVLLALGLVCCLLVALISCSINLTCEVLGHHLIGCNLIGFPLLKLHALIVEFLTELLNHLHDATRG